MAYAYFKYVLCVIIFKKSHNLFNVGEKKNWQSVFQNSTCKWQHNKILKALLSGPFTLWIPGRYGIPMVLLSTV